MAQKDRNKRGCHVVKYLLYVVSTHKGIASHPYRQLKSKHNIKELAETIVSYEHTCKSRRRKCHCHSVHHHHMLHLSHGFVDAGTGLSWDEPTLASYAWYMTKQLCHFKDEHTELTLQTSVKVHIYLGASLCAYGTVSILILTKLTGKGRTWCCFILLG